MTDVRAALPTPRWSSTDQKQPNFLHAGDHVHLGPGVTSARRTNPAVDLHELPRIDLVLLSHYHAYAIYPQARP
jgi:L-ascorbate metabolism protein UlaG (beta-lactamase superfamily)